MDSQIQELQTEIERLRLSEKKAQELSKAVAQANANAAEMYIELEEKSQQITLLKEQMEHEMNAAQEVQNALMTTGSLNYPELTVTVDSKPASVINGDFYLVHPMDRNNIAILIADGVGHGVPAALMTIMARTFFMEISAENSSAGGIFTKLNRKLKSNFFEGGYLTAFLFIYNRSTNYVKYSGAGHPRAIFWQKAKHSFTFLEANNPVLGVVSNHSYSEDVVEVDRGDRFFLYTDGIEELRNKEGEFFGSRRILDLIREGCPSLSVEEIKQSVFEETGSYSAGAEQPDDQTFIAFEILKETPRDKIRMLLADFNNDSSHKVYLSLYTAGIESFRKKDYDDSIHIFDQIVKHQPDNAKAHYNLGMGYMKIGKRQNAMDCWQKVLSLLDHENGGLVVKENEKNILKEKTIRMINSLKVVTMAKEARLRTVLSELSISVPREKLVEFCQKAVDMPTFQGLELHQSESEIFLEVPGYPGLRLPLDSDRIGMGPELFQDDFPPQICLVFEGLAAVFGGTYVVSYFEAGKARCNVSVVDGIYIHCGERCLVRDVAFPQID